MAASVARLTAGRSRKELASAYSRISDAYRGSELEYTQPVRTRADATAYAAARMPATFAALARALEEVRLQRPSFAPRTILDLGTGPGTALWAALGVWNSPETLTAVDSGHDMLVIARALGTKSTRTALRGCTWEQADLAAWTPDDSYDLVLLGYVIGELGSEQRTQLLHRAWEACDGVVVVVEPGSVGGYQRVLEARNLLIQNGGAVVAPCPHARRCPLEGRDWCHFGTRVARSSDHRVIKDGSLAYEDEPYSYIAVSRADGPAAAARVIRRPQRLARRVVLDLCGPAGAERRTIGKSSPAYPAAKQATWGSAFDR